MNFQLSDSVLLSRVKGGCKESFRILYDRYFDFLYQYSFTLLKDTQQSQDLIQELFVQLWEKKGYLEITNLKSYLTAALRNKVINTYRNNKYVDLDEELISQLVSPIIGDEQLEENDLEMEFNRILNNLPRKCRNVFYLSRIKNYRNKEIAEELDISIRTVETHISNALQYFKVLH
ncbi:RNA polymerase sigma-70 factor [Cytophaga sp. FL35]|uniref:RNA polymerase sigma factor n=1 Tax=Cytophaga sp. FL35 TaxID=1904456 RepID=UPI0016539B10|nr:RNA polymerase sigma-70 factor [Cytophaga sp. FL35]MBC6999417.1 RNA polymerase sigma-70 factor [Cytophaga sp. FL35]